MHGIELDLGAFVTSRSPGYNTKCGYSPVSEAFGDTRGSFIVQPMDVVGYKRVSLEEQATRDSALIHKRKRYVDIANCTILTSCIFTLTRGIG